MIEFRFSDFFYPRDLLRTYWLMRRSEFWRGEQFNAYQAARLASLLRFCSQEVDFYIETFKSIGLKSEVIDKHNAFEHLQALPVLDKDMVREQPDRFIARNAEKFRPMEITTSGTTGTPLTVYWDRGSNVMEFCSIQRLWRWAGIRIGDSFLDLRSRVFEGTDKRVRKADGVVYARNWKINGLELSSDLLDESNIQRYYELLLKYKPRMVRGHPQSIHHLITLLQKKELFDWKPKAVTPASETIYPFQRQLIEDIWRAPILDSYGLKEHNVFIAQCPQKSYHIFPEYGYCEILDDHWNPVAPGEEGWIVATGLHNYAQVLLRYNTRDRAVAARGEGICECGRTLPVVDRIIGRIDDCIYTGDGKRYSGMHFAFFGKKGIKKARLIQRDYRKVTVELVPDAAFDEGERNTLLADLNKKVDKKLTFEIKIVDSIAQEGSGKFKFVLSELDARSEG